MPTYYEMLRLENERSTPQIPPQVVKAAYRQALLRSHPDKQAQRPAQREPSSAAAHPDRFSIDDLSLAQKVLSDPALKAAYDRSLLASSFALNEDARGREAAAEYGHRTGLETVDLDSLLYDEQSSSWSRSCRCGDSTGFILREPELEENVDEGEVTVGCRGCSLWLRVVYSVED